MAAGYTEDLPETWGSFLARAHGLIHPSRASLRHMVEILVRRASNVPILPVDDEIVGIEVSTLELAEEMGSQNGVRCLLGTLERHGWLTVHRRPPSGRGRLSNIYDLKIGPQIDTWRVGRTPGSRNNYPKRRKRRTASVTAPLLKRPPAPVLAPELQSWGTEPIADIPKMIWSDVPNPIAIQPATAQEWAEWSIPERVDWVAWLAEQKADDLKLSRLQTDRQAGEISSCLASALRSPSAASLQELSTELRGSVLTLYARLCSAPAALISQMQFPAGDHRDVARRQGIGSVGMMAVLTWIRHHGPRKPFAGVEEFATWAGFQRLRPRIRDIWDRLLKSEILTPDWKGRGCFWVNQRVSWEKAAEKLGVRGITAKLQAKHKMLRAWWDQKVKGIRSWSYDRQGNEVSDRVDDRDHEPYLLRAQARQIYLGGRRAMIKAGWTPERSSFMKVGDLVNKLRFQASS